MAGHFSLTFRGRKAGAVLASLCLFSIIALSPGSGHALTEPKKAPLSGETLPDQPPADAEIPGDGKTLPLPGPLIVAPEDQPAGGTETAPAQAPEGDEHPSNVEVLRDVSKIPEPVIRMRELIVEAAASGDIERLRPLMITKDGTTQVSIGDQPEDPILALKGLSGDQEGREVLAILLDILQTGFVRLDAGTPEETYVWPYFTEKQLDQLSPPEMVELLRIVTAGDMADMKEFGGYNFYRVGISAKGEWKFFVAGD